MFEIDKNEFEKYKDIIDKNKEKNNNQQEQIQGIKNIKVNTENIKPKKNYKYKLKRILAAASVITFIGGAATGYGLSKVEMPSMESISTTQEDNTVYPGQIEVPSGHELFEYIDKDAYELTGAYILSDETKEKYDVETVVVDGKEKQYLVLKDTDKDQEYTGKTR